MKFKSILYFIFVSQIYLAAFLDHENPLKYTDKNIFVAIGITGEGKSLFMNAISKNKSKFSVSSKGNSETQEVQDVEFKYQGNTFVGIDTPGLDDSNYNDEIIQKLKQLIHDYPTIKCLLIVKKYNNFRISESLQEAIKVFIDSFPLENFWDHVIIINTWANPNDENFINYYKYERQPFIEKIKNCNNLKAYMDKKGIKFPYNITEYYIDTKQYPSNKIIKEKFNEIKNVISKKDLMFKEIVRSDEEKIRVEKSSKYENLYIIKTYRMIYFTDFNNKTMSVEEILNERVEKISDANKIKDIIEKKYLETDYIRWYDIATLSVSWWFRTKYKYEVSEKEEHKIGNENIIIQKKIPYEVWRWWKI